MRTHQPTFDFFSKKFSKSEKEIRKIEIGMSSAEQRNWKRIYLFAWVTWKRNTEWSRKEKKVFSRFLCLRFRRFSFSFSLLLRHSTCLTAYWLSSGLGNCSKRSYNTLVQLTQSRDRRGKGHIKHSSARESSSWTESSFSLLGKTLFSVKRKIFFFHYSKVFFTNKGRKQQSRARTFNFLFGWCEVPFWAFHGRRAKEKLVLCVEWIRKKPWGSAEIWQTQSAQQCSLFLCKNFNSSSLRLCSCTEPSTSLLSYLRLTEEGACQWLLRCWEHFSVKNFHSFLQHHQFSKARNQN